MTDQVQTFMPVMWLGTYSLNFGPLIQYDEEDTVAVHDILGGNRQTSEPIGYTLEKLQISGFLYSAASNQALLDMVNFTATTRYRGRPVSVGFFTHDNGSGASSSQLWYSNVGYLTAKHFEYGTGKNVFHYPYRFAFIEASPQTLISCSDSGDHTNYTFSMTTAGNGFIAAVQIVGATISTAANAAQSITAILDNSSATIGTGPTLGSAANLLFNGNPVTVNGGAAVPNVNWPVKDVSGNQSIQRTSPTGTYTVTFAHAFSSLPSSVNVVYLPV